MLRHSAANVAGSKCRGTHATVAGRKSRVARWRVVNVPDAIVGVRLLLIQYPYPSSRLRNTTSYMLRLSVKKHWELNQISLLCVFGMAQTHFLQKKEPRA